jgi:putative hydrolase
MPRYEFHSHSFFSDGELLPIELIRRAKARGHACIAVTDHAGPSNVVEIVRKVREDCVMATSEWGIIALAGVEITHVPPSHISRIARIARDEGAQIIVVHGEVIVEPVQEGTNLAAVSDPNVDVLAHPGFMTKREAEIAAKNGVFVELTAKLGGAYTNAHVARLCLAAGAKMVVNTDTHKPEDLITEEFAMLVARGCGLTASQAEQVVNRNPLLLLKRLGV